MSAGSLLMELRSLAANTPLLRTEGVAVSADSLRAEGEALRLRWAASERATVCLSGLKPGQLIEALVALDGYAAGMLLLPAGLTPAVQRDLAARAGCTVTIRQDMQCRIETAPSRAAGEAETAWILATSGTTGTPKLIAHTLASLSRTVKRNTEVGAALTWGLLYDPCRFAGLQVVLQSLIGGSMLALPSTLDFEDQVSSLLEGRVNAISATPALWRKLLQDGRVKALRLRQATLGGEVVDQSILNALRKAFTTARIVHIYASTEAGTGFVVRDGRAGFPSQWLTEREGPVPLRVDENGRLWIKPGVLATAAVISERLDDDGFLDTDDLVRVDGDRVYFSGRASGAINVGGNKVHPEEVEAHLRSIPGVADARVFGRASSLMGQLVVAEVVAEPSEALDHLRRQIQARCRDELLPWQRPTLITFTKALVESAAGKRDRALTS